jgi:hypothetical protein
VEAVSGPEDRPAAVELTDAPADSTDGEEADSEVSDGNEQSDDELLNEDEDALDGPPATRATLLSSLGSRSSGGSVSSPTCTASGVRHGSGIAIVRRSWSITTSMERRWGHVSSESA